MEITTKYTIIYSFKVVDGKENEFIKCWTDLTKLIYEFEGSYGSRLHRLNKNLFIAYAQWPDKETFDLSGNNLPEAANGLRKQMREYCSEIKPEFTLDRVVCDLLKDEQHSNFIQPEAPKN